MQRVLLIVDDRDDQLRAFRRTLEEQFDIIRLAHDCREAEECLNQQPVVTHLLCDMWLGASGERGDLLVGEWRRRYPSIQLAVLMTGDSLERSAMPAHEGIDAYVEKPVDPDLLRTIMAA